MPRSSRHKSHKQHKHGFKESRGGHSDSEEDKHLKDLKERKPNKDEVVVRVSRDLSSSEKRKLAESKDSYDEHGSSKRRKERSDADRWNGTEAGRGGSGNSKVSVDSKSKSSSRRRDGLVERKEENTVGLVVVGSEEIRKSSSSASKVESKRKSEKDLGRKEDHNSKEKEVEVEKGSRKVQDVRRESEGDTLPVRGISSSEASRKQGSQSGGALVDERPPKQDVEKITVWPGGLLGFKESSLNLCAGWGGKELKRQIQDGPRNSKVEKEVEKRIRRGDGSSDNIKHQDDARDASDRRLSMRDDRAKNGKNKDDKNKNDSYKEKYREDLDRDYRARDDKRREAHDMSDGKYSREEIKILENRTKKSKPQGGDRDDSPLPDDRSTRYKDSREKKRSSEINEDHNILKTRDVKELRPIVEKKVMRSGKVDLVSDRGRSQTSHGDVESTISSSRRKRSPSPRAHFVNDQYRYSSKQPELKYKNSESEDRVRPNVISSKELGGVSGHERASESRSMEKPRSIEKSRSTTNPIPFRKEENHIIELSTERSPISDGHAPTSKLMEKSHSSTDIDRRQSNRANARRSLDVDETGRRSSGSKDAREYSANEDRGSRDVLYLEKSAADDGDAMSVSSSINRKSSSLLPPPPLFRSGADNNSSVLGSSEDDNRGRPNNRYKRGADSNMGRGQGNNVWRGVPNWASPIPNGYIPFPHGPPPAGFHPMMQQFSAPPMFGVRPSVELNPSGVPYHISDGDRFSGHVRPFGWRNPGDELHGWDGNNNMFGDESHMHGRQDWDHNRHMMNGSGWGEAGDMWKGQSLVNMEVVPSAPQKDDSLKAPADELWSGHSVKRLRGQPSSREESIEINLSDETLPAKDISEMPVQTLPEKPSEPFKTLNDNSHQFCQLYLSKLDISVDLTNPELYEQCMSLLNIEGGSYENDVTNHVLLECGGTRISNTTLNTSLFPSIKPSVFERAMSLYKKQAAEMKGIVPVSSSLVSDQLIFPTTDGDVSELVTTSCEVKQETIPHLEGKMELNHIPSVALVIISESVPTISNEKAKEQVPVVDQEVAVDAVPVFVQEIADTAVLLVDCKKVEDLVPTSNAETEEEDLVQSLCEVKVEEAVPTHCEAINVSNVTAEEDLVKMEEVVEVESPFQANPPKDEEDSEVSSPPKGIDAVGSPKEAVAFSDTVCLPLGFTNSTSSEALIPESIECRLVNLSRIHSPESTH
ncbi:hypothetical protein GIB67_006417 [Kingdonia uniflora]|uniref:Uncharacterized protein n=1 Tax=Kingdonia uniflora TaxID=39325 RepID=A0A7J7P0U0_9MAGN|nr:hypothetical protein GIB67_006417 [Kingdonia uniflora]